MTFSVQAAAKVGCPSDVRFSGNYTRPAGGPCIDSDDARGRAGEKEGGRKSEREKERESERNRDGWEFQLKNGMRKACHRTGRPAAVLIGPLEDWQARRKIDRPASGLIGPPPALVFSWPFLAISGPREEQSVIGPPQD